VAMYLEDIYTLSANMAGIPAMSAPAGFVGGRPVGLHIMGNYFNEAKLLNIAHQYLEHCPPVSANHRLAFTNSSH